MLIFFILLPILILVFFVYASYSINAGIYIKTLCRAETKDKRVALTFDDGPDAVQTSKVLDVLQKFDVKACFFCIGNKVEGNEALLQRMIDEGHLIGNHSYNHNFSFTLQSSKRVEQDLKDCEDTIKQRLNYKIKLFRPPFGVTNPAIAKSIKKLDYIPIGWSIRSLDTCKSVETVLNRIQKQLHPGAIILLHDPLPTSHELLSALLEYLQKEGYKIERLDTLLEINNLL